MITGMSAAHALRLTNLANDPGNFSAEAALNCWYAAIERAARAGQRSVREHAVHWPADKPPAAAQKSALDRLKKGGFGVKTVQDGPNEYTTEVSW